MSFKHNYPVLYFSLVSTFTLAIFVSLSVNVYKYSESNLERISAFGQAIVLETKQFIFDSDDYHIPPSMKFIAVLHGINSEGQVIFSRIADKSGLKIKASLAGISIVDKELVASHLSQFKGKNLFVDYYGLQTHFGQSYVVLWESFDSPVNDTLVDLGFAEPSTTQNLNISNMLQASHFWRVAKG